MLLEGEGAGAPQPHSVTMSTQVKGDRSDSQRRSKRRSAPPSGAHPAPVDGFDSQAGALAYVKHFPRPELGEHPRHDGYDVGRALARAYPEKMQKVMQGFREGVKEGTKAAAEAGGQSR